MEFRIRGGGERRMKNGFKWNRKGVSPVIATIIIVAIAIVMSIAVAYWMLGLGAAFTKYEKLEFTTAYAIKTTTGTPFFTVYMIVKNTGSATATIDTPSILFNGKPASGYATTPTVWFNQTTLNPGEVARGNINMTESSEWIGGMTVEIMMHTVAGKDYPKVIMLP
jgi:flagellin-like protein